MITILLAVVVAFLGLGFFAGSEMAYLSCNKLKLRHLSDEGNPRAKIVLRFHRDPKRFLTDILIATNLTHVAITGLVTYFFESQFPLMNEWVAVGVLSLIIIFAEIIYKDWFRYYADDFIYRFAYLLDFLDRILSGVSHIMIFLTDVLINATAPKIKRSPFVTREEFRYVIEESAKGGVLLTHEKELINTILNLSSVRTEEVMVPVAKFPKVVLTAHLKDVKDIARRSKTEAILVYEEIPTLIVGVVYVFDILFEEGESQTLSRFLKAPLFINHDLTAEKAIFALQSKHASYAAVINPAREVIGVVSLETLIRF